MFDELRSRRPGFIGEEAYRKYAVMVALVEHEGETCVLFEQRARTLKRQPGEVCFPGGAREPDETSEENAVRETMEELLIQREQIDVIAQMDTLFTTYDNKISVYLCELKNYEMTYSEAEVGKVFLVPLSFFLENEPDVYQNDVILKHPENFPYNKIPGGRGYNWKSGRSSV